MFFNLKLIHESVHLELKIASNDTETLTQSSWLGLYNSAQNNKVPYYMISTAVVYNGTKYVGYSYDGLSLQKLLKLSQKDPLSQLPIIKTYHTFLRCFETVDSIEDPLSLKPAQLLTSSAFDLYNLPPQYQEIAFAGLNFYALEKGEQKKMIGKCQFIIGSFILNNPPYNTDAMWQSEARQWLLCASHCGIAAAHKILGVDSLCQADETQQAGINHLHEAIAEGDSQAIKILTKTLAMNDQSNE